MKPRPELPTWVCLNHSAYSRLSRREIYPSLPAPWSPLVVELANSESHDTRKTAVREAPLLLLLLLRLVESSRE